MKDFRANILIFSNVSLGYIALRLVRGQWLYKSSFRQASKKIKNEKKKYFLLSLSSENSLLFGAENSKQLDNNKKGGGCRHPQTSQQ